jgi:hypothetical protein
MNMIREEVTYPDSRVEVREYPAPDAAAIPVPVQPVHIAWLKLALHDIGKLQAVEAAVKQDARVSILWASVTTISPTDPEVVMLSKALAIDIPTLFAAAHAIASQRAGSLE